MSPHVYLPWIGNGHYLSLGGGGKIWLFHDKIYLIFFPPQALYDSKGEKNFIGQDSYYKIQIYSDYFMLFI